MLSISCIMAACVADSMGALTSTASSYILGGIAGTNIVAQLPEHKGTS